jgi:hypothetical protein
MKTMVCPNCKSDQIIQVQDQFFCINCGQQVPAPAPKAPKVPAVAVQDNGLPEGVKILPVAAGAKTEPAEPAPDAPTPEVVPLIKPRARITVEADQADDGAKPRKRKPGRPKAGPLDAPRVVPSLAPAAQLPATPLPAAPPVAPEPVAVTTPAPAAEPAPAPPTGPKRMSDLSPRRAAAAEATKPRPHKAKKSFLSLHLPKLKPQAKDKPKAKPKAAQVHNVGVPPLHYGAVLSFSLRARVRPRLLGLAALAPISFAGAAGYGAWLVTHDGLQGWSRNLTAHGPKLLLGAGLLAALYYIGRSIGQAAITYGVAREADQRPVSLSRQLGVGINTFGRRLVLDLGYGAVEIVIIGLIVALVWIGGEAWPMDTQIQVVALFCAFLLLLYMQTAVSIARGLAGVILTLTPKRPREAASIGWQLFSHRFELLGLRFLGVATELVLALPLAAVAVAVVLSVPSQWAWVTSLAVGLLALVAGALLGVGTASWWAALYRRLVLVDHPGGAVTLLSGRQPAEANRGPLTLVVALSSLLLAAVLSLPLLNIF